MYRPQMRGIEVRQASCLRDERDIVVSEVSGSRDGVPAGSEWIKADIASLLSDLPDKIELKVDAGTVSDELSTVEIVEGAMCYESYSYKQKDIAKAVRRICDGL